MDVKFINPFLQGTIEVLKKMAFVEAKPGKVYLKNTSIAYGDVSGVIGITGDAVGSLAISFTEACICNIANKILGETYQNACQEVFDAVGEVTNMISGVARNYLEKESMSVYAAIPSVVFGKDHTIDHILNGPSIVIPFITEKGSFVVDVCIRKTEAKEKESQKYHVINKKTPVASATPVKQGGVSNPVPPEKKDKMTLMQKKLQELSEIRKTIAQQLDEQPFMEIQRRKMLKKRLPYLDVQIKRLKLDITAHEMLSKIKEEDMENPQIAPHYQHYDNKKHKTR
ncbi:MAG: chemotaxis protein CheX [Deltaproteobacteria bacterium]|nr:chemotaxis protein CheX [Deltaproteobacteria bacterium]